MSPDAPPPTPDRRHETQALRRIADSARLGFELEPIPGAPRDVSIPPAEADAFYVVTVRAGGSSTPPLRTLFVGLLSDAEQPSAETVLWWLAADAWMIEHCRRDLGMYCSVYNHGVDEPAVRRLFGLQVGQANALLGLLGQERYAALLSTYADATRREPVDWGRWDDRSGKPAEPGAVS